MSAPAGAGASGGDPGDAGPQVDPAGWYAGEADGFERLWTPHRMAYIGGVDKPADEQEGPQCPFCRAREGEDADGLVVARGEECFAVLNLYPYNPGHLMVCPYRHVAAYVDLTESETVEVARMTRTALRVLAEVSAPHGFNLGVNQGAVAGAGIAGHLHQHVVPRWGGDANFLPVVGRTKAVPELLGDTRAKLAAAWPAPDRARP
ncbi:HIT domain-containing protein [Pseudokineococcus sp. 5B2Z-1]|uniref:HIT family protein n=1 Tax=Pseudokineococcus sp. 5B2Z-1 TaxID=3132744 RepID=UPI0030B36745